jgi:YD repeat-containing protein
MVEYQNEKRNPYTEILPRKVTLTTANLLLDDLAGVHAIPGAYDLSGRIQTQQNYQAASTTYTYSPNGKTVGVDDPTSGLTTMVCDWENLLNIHENGAAVASYLYYTDNMKAVENTGGS